MYARFLCVQQVMFRPALEIFFQRQQNQITPDAIDDMAKSKVEDSMLSSIAARCVRSAIDLVIFLVAQIETGTFICWWYNIHCKFNYTLKTSKR